MKGADGKYICKECGSELRVARVFRVNGVRGDPMGFGKYRVWCSKDITHKTGFRFDSEEEKVISK